MRATPTPTESVHAGNLAAPRTHGKAVGVAEALLVVTAMALAALTRLGWPGIYSFAFDEARVSQLALEMARAGQPAAAGIQSSAGLPNPPGFVWLMAVPYALSRDPLVASLAVALANVFAVAGVWHLARSAWGLAAGLAAALLLAGSPYAAFYSRAVWGQDLLIPVAVAWALLAVGCGGGAAGGAQGAAGARGFRLAAMVAVAGFAPQVHYAGAVLLLPTAWLVVRCGLWRRWRPLLAGAALALLAAAPFALHLWRSRATLLASAKELAGGPLHLDLTALGQLLELATGRGWEWFLLGDAWHWETPLDDALVASQVAVAAMAVLGLAALLRDALRRGAGTRVGGALALLLPAWALSGPLVFAQHLTPPYRQYQLAALPALFLLAAHATRLVRRRAWAASVSALALAVALVQAGAFCRGLDVVAQRLTPGGIGTPLSYPRAAARALQDGGEIVVHAHGDEAAYLGDVAGFEVLLWGYPHRVADGRSVLLVPAAREGAAAPHLLFTFEDLPAWSVAGDVLAGATEASHPRREGEPPYASLTGANPAPSALDPLEPVRLANGAELTGWRAEWRSDTLRILTQWTLHGAADGLRYHQFHHVRANLEGEPLAGADVPTSSSAWRAGDTLFVWADVPPPEGGWPAEPLWVDVGMYTWPEVARVPVEARPGDPLAPIRLGPVAPPR